MHFTNQQSRNYNCKIRDGGDRLYRLGPVDELLHVILQTSVRRKPEDLEVGLAAAECHRGPRERVKPLKRLVQFFILKICRKTNVKIVLPITLI